MSQRNDSASEIRSIARMSFRCFSDPPSRKNSSLRMMTYSGGAELQSKLVDFVSSGVRKRPCVQRVVAARKIVIYHRLR